MLLVEVASLRQGLGMRLGLGVGLGLRLGQGQRLGLRLGLGVGLFSVTPSCELDWKVTVMGVQTRSHVE